MSHNPIKDGLLGMPLGTASGRLRKNIMFNLATRLGEHICFHCKQPILNVSEFSIEHKVPWQGTTDPVRAFFDMENIAFSHYLCNIKAASRPNKRFENSREKSTFHYHKNADKYRARFNANRKAKRALERPNRV